MRVLAAAPQVSERCRSNSAIARSSGVEAWLVDSETFPCFRRKLRKRLAEARNVMNVREAGKGQRHRRRCLPRKRAITLSFKDLIRIPLDPSHLPKCSRA